MCLCGVLGNLFDVAYIDYCNECTDVFFRSIMDSICITEECHHECYCGLPPMIVACGLRAEHTDTRVIPIPKEHFHKNVTVSHKGMLSLG